MYDTITIPPPSPSSSNVLSPQIISKRSLSTSSSCATPSQSPIDSPVTPAEVEGEESNARRDSVANNAPLIPTEDDDEEERDIVLDKITEGVRIMSSNSRDDDDVNSMNASDNDIGDIDATNTRPSSSRQSSLTGSLTALDGAGLITPGSEPEANATAVDATVGSIAPPETPNTPTFNAFMEFINEPTDGDALKASLILKDVEEEEEDVCPGDDAGEAGTAVPVKEQEKGDSDEQAVAADRSGSEGEGNHNMVEKVPEGSSTAGEGANEPSEPTMDTETTPLGTTEVLPSVEAMMAINDANDETLASTSAEAAQQIFRKPSSAPEDEDNSDACFPQPQPQLYQQPPKYIYSNRYPTEMDNYTTLQDGKNKVGKRCYRLNLERPLDLQCEQSPLEYGDYMAPWTKEVFPRTVGPTEYCPPRHLGGEEVVWRELMRWSDAADRAKEEELHDDERKTNSLDEVEGSKKIASGVLSPGGSVHLDAKVDAVAAGVGAVDLADEEKPASADEIKGEPLTSVGSKDAGAQAAGVGTCPTAGWRTLGSEEITTVQKLGGRNQFGEYSFQTYDLSHVMLNTAQGKGIMRDENGNIVSDFPGVGQLKGQGQGGRATTPIPALRTVFSMDSTTSEDEKLNPKSPEEMADDTARLFRRSELSLREKAEREAEEEAEKERIKRQKELEEMEERQRKERETGLLSDDSPLDKSQRSRKKAHSRRFSSGGKKLLRGISKAFSDINGTPSNADSSWRGSSHRRANSSSSSGRNAGMVKRSSMQALTIDKARDLVDESDDEDVSVVGEDDDEEKKKPLNVALYILGEYDILNDLANDGAKRLRENSECTDLDILMMNDPCPPPDRWVRTTGWSKCNPSSMYATYPPEDFDWIRYYDTMRERTDEYKEKFLGDKGPQDNVSKTSVHHKNSDMTETTAGASGSNSSEGQHPVTPPRASHARKASRAPDLSPIMSPGRNQAKTLSGDGGDVLSQSARSPRTSRATRNSAGAGAKSHFNKSPSNAANDLLSQSARTPQNRSSSSSVKKSHFRSASNSAASSGSDMLSQSARTPRRSVSTSGGGARGHFNKDKDEDSLSQSARTPRGRKSGFGRKMSSMLKGK